MKELNNLWKISKEDLDKTTFLIYSWGGVLEFRRTTRDDLVYYNLNVLFNSRSWGDMFIELPCEIHNSEPIIERENNWTKFFYKKSKINHVVFVEFMVYLGSQIMTNKEKISGSFLDKIIKDFRTCYS